MAGWIKIYRSFKEWQHYGNPVMVQLFLHLLLSANYEDVERNGMLLKRGQYLTSINKLASELGITVKVARNYLKKLVETGEILKETVPITMGTTFGTTSGTTKAPTLSLITICNYDRYQDAKFDDGTTSGTTLGTTSGTYIKNNINNNKEKISTTTYNAHAPERDKLHEEIEEMKGNEIWLEQICMKHHVQLSELDELFKEFKIECLCNDKKEHQNLTDAKQHFNKWLRFYIKEKKNGSNRRNNPNDNIERAQQQAIAESMELIRKAKERDSQI